MALPDIQLDDRRFEDLVAEARRRIPAYTPEWTDHNDSDPGITLIQLFAYLEEIILYRLNQVPQKNFVKFLELVGIELNPPSPAHVELTFKLTSKDLPNAVAIPQGSRASVSGGSGPIIFATDDNLLAVGADLTAIQSFDGGQFSVLSESNRLSGANFYPLSRTPQRNAALYLGFDRSFPKGRHRLTVHAAGTGASVIEGGAATAPDPAPPVLAFWEYWSGTGTGWQRLAVASDTTRNLTRSGAVLFDAPTDMVASKFGMLQKPDDPALFWFRFRIDQILGSGYDAPPQLSDVLLNTIPATNAVTETDELLGASNGGPNQTFSLSHTPIFPKGDNVAGIVAVNEGKGYEVWTEVRDFSAYDRTATVYTLNHSTGIVGFGDGEHGKIPQWLSGDSSNSEAADIPNIKATEYRWGGGSGGNVGAQTITSLESTIPFVDTVTNLRPAVGGQDEETVAQAGARAPLSIRTQSRAVTAEDFSFLATQTPGAQIARAQALPLYSAKLQLARSAGGDLPANALPMPGVLTVVVVPNSPDPKPMPSEATLKLVTDWLDQHRLVTAQLCVTAPRYRKVEIEARVIVDVNSSVGLIQQQLQDKLLTYFNPIKGGPDGKGWEFGGGIYFSETYRQILITPGVLRIESGALRTFLDDVEQPSGQDISLGPDEVVYSINHTIMVSYP